jgi:hypothetical protein
MKMIKLVYITSVISMLVCGFCAITNSIVADVIGDSTILKKTHIFAFGMSCLMCFFTFLPLLHSSV